MNKIMALANPYLSLKGFFQKSDRLLSILTPLACMSLVLALFGALYWAPADYQQKDAFRIIYIHVPAAFLSLGIYTAMSVAAFFSFVWRLKLADLFIQSAVPIGTSMTALALVTGSIWGKPMWGTWWIWDARLTTELILLFIYLAHLLLRSALRHKPIHAQKAVALFTLIGFIDIPLIHFSVTWWQTLHQGPTLSRLAKPTMPIEMLWPLLLMLFAFSLCAALMIVWHLRAHILVAEQEKRWVKQYA